MRNQKSVNKEKICNKCGEYTLNYTVFQNAPLCNKCVPVKQIKKIMNEKNMIEKLLPNSQKKLIETGEQENGQK